MSPFIICFCHAAQIFKTHVVGEIITLFLFSHQIIFHLTSITFFASCNHHLMGTSDCFPILTIMNTAIRTLQVDPFACILLA